MKIITICPSRGRPGILGQMIESWKRTRDCAYTSLVVILDSNDAHNYPREDGVDYIVVENSTPGTVQMLNQVACKMALEQPESIFFFINDDVLFQTMAWDTDIQEEMDKYNGWRLVYPDDGHQSGRNCPFFAVSGKMINSLGFVAYPKLKHFWVDTWWYELAGKLQIGSYLQEVLVEHIHPHARKRDMDETLHRTTVSESYDRAVFSSWKAAEIRDHIRAIQDAIDAENGHVSRRLTVSVIMPTQNRRPELMSAALRSIASQKERPLEVVVVSDGAGEPDSSVLDICRSGGIDVKVVVLDKHSGPGVARHAGIEAASGTHIAYLDDDDYYLPHHISTLLGLVEDTPGARFVYSGTMTDTRDAQGNGEIKGSYNFPFDGKMLLEQNYIPTLSILHEKQLYLDAGPYRSDLGTHEDWELWIRMSKICDFTHTPTYTCVYRRSDDIPALTTRNRSDFNESYKKIRKLHAS